ncbi:MAG: hypothetical protein ABSC94_18400 [Polyangiaceae bacterium]|jgi:hypothetical protein
MRSTPALVLASLPFIFACGAKGPAAKSPEPSAQNSSADSDSEAAPGKTPAAGDDANKCTGFEIPDLLAILSQTSCELPDGSPPPKERDLKDVLDVSVSVDPHVAPGATAKVRVVYKNKGKTDLPLDFTVDPEPRFAFKLYTLKGKRADKPAGDEPALPPELANATAPDQKVARVIIAPNGTATTTLSWDAVRYKWASKEKAKGAAPGHGYPREPAGPLAKGKYVLRVVTSLVGVFEGVDHEISQPRTEVQIGGG